MVWPLQIGITVPRRKVGERIFTSSGGPVRPRAHAAVTLQMGPAIVVAAPSARRSHVLYFIPSLLFPSLSRLLWISHRDQDHRTCRCRLHVQLGRRVRHDSPRSTEAICSHRHAEAVTGSPRHVEVGIRFPRRAEAVIGSPRRAEARRCFATQLALRGFGFSSCGTTVMVAAPSRVIGLVPGPTEAATAGTSRLVDITAGAHDFQSLEIILPCRRVAVAVVTVPGEAHGAATPASKSLIGAGAARASGRGSGGTPNSAARGQSCGQVGPGNWSDRDSASAASGPGDQNHQHPSHQ